MNLLKIEAEIGRQHLDQNWPLSPVQYSVVIAPLIFLRSNEVEIYLEAQSYEKPSMQDGIKPEPTNNSKI